MTKVVTTLSPEEWYRFQMGRLTIVERTDETHFLKAHLEGRQDSLRKGKYDGEYINFSLNEVGDPDPLDEFAQDPWDFSFAKDSVTLELSKDKVYRWHIIVE